MPHRPLAYALAGLLVATAAPARAGEVYAIRVRAPDTGEVIRVQKEETRTTRLTAYDGLGRQVLDQREKEVETFDYRETVLEKSPAGKPTSLSRRYEKAQRKQGNAPARNLALHGKTLRIGQEGGKFRFTFEGGGPVPGADAAMLDREFNAGDEKFRLDSLLPPKPVPVGAEWPVDMGPLVKDFLRTGRFGAEPSLATGSGHLNKTTPMGGDQFGLIVYRMEIPLREMAVNGPVRGPVLPGSKATFELTLDLCIDGARPEGTFLSTGEIKATAALLQPGAAPGRLTFTHKCDTREVRKPDEQKERTTEAQRTQRQDTQRKQ